MMRAGLELISRDLKLAVRQGGGVGTALGFYLVVIAFLPLGLGPDLALLSRIAPGVLWVGLLLAALLSLPRIFESDDEDGSLEVLATGPLPLELVCAAKAAAHWISTGVPLTLMSPLLGILLNLDGGAYMPLMMTMLVGTPAISFLGSIGAALTLRAKKGGMLIALLVLPLYVPTLIYGIAAVGAAVLGGEGSQGAFLLVSALSLGALVLGPIAAAAALRIQMQ